MYEFSREPLGIGQQLDHAFRLTRRTYGAALGVILLTGIIGALGALANVNFAVDPENAETIPPSAIGGLILFSLMNLYLYFLLVVRVVYAAFDRGDMADAMVTAFRKFIPLILLFICLGLAVTLGMVLLIIPGLILAISLSLSMYCMAIENTGPIESLRRSHSLIWGNWLRTATVLTIAGLVVGVFYILIGMVLAAVILTTDDQTGVTITNVLVSLIGPFVQPFFIAVGLVIYNDVRLRKEGDDLDAQIAEL